MNPQTLTTYLNDHMAGSVAALELIEHLAQLSAGTEQERWFRALGSEIEEDHQVLGRLIEGMGGKQSRGRRAAAWLAEKFAEFKLKADDPGTGQLRVLEALETLALGIQGKLALWRALGTAGLVPGIHQMDLARLEQRARKQFEQVEAERLKAAKAAFGS